MVAIRDAGKVKQLQELIKDVDQQPDILVGDEGAVEVSSAFRDSGGGGVMVWWWVRQLQESQSLTLTSSRMKGGSWGTNDQKRMLARCSSAKAD
jgi:hypothetical protein